MKASTPLLVVALIAVSCLPVSSGQTETPQGLFNYDLTVDDPAISIPFGSGGGAGEVHGTFRDLSLQGSSYPAGSPDLPVVQSRTTLRAIADPDPGWQVGTPNPFSLLTSPSDVIRFTLPITIGSGVQSPQYRINLTATITDPNNTPHVLYVRILASTPGIPNFGVIGQPPFPNKLAPRQVYTGNIQVRNLNFQPQNFDFKVADNPCGMAVGLPSQVTIGGREGPDHGIQVFTVSFQAPGDLLYLFGTGCPLAITVNPSDQPGRVQSVIYNPQVIGTNVTFPVIFNTLAVIVLLVLLFFFLRRRKERLEEEILGKPQKPWLIPVEQVYLRHLKAKDQRAWYVVRHYLMEDEYRSSLLWYKAYKKATKDDRAKERLVLVQEKRYARWKRGWERDIEKPIVKADRFQAKLQKKLDRKASKAHRKAMSAWRNEVRKLEAKHDKEVEKEDALHAKLLARARKKGLPEPERQALAEPELPAEPVLQARPLAEHRWAKKEARFRRRRLKEQGNLEVKFEKADARKQAKLRRKVEKLSRDLGDAEFVAQHTAHE